jgi:hypothetical protein
VSPELKSNSLKRNVIACFYFCWRLTRNLVHTGSCSLSFFLIFSVSLFVFLSLSISLSHFGNFFIDGERWSQTSALHADMNFLLWKVGKILQKEKQNNLNCDRNKLLIIFFFQSFKRLSAFSVFLLHLTTMLTFKKCNFTDEIKL